MTTPFLPNTPLGRVVSPVNTIKPGYTQTANRSSTLPSRLSPSQYDSDVKQGYSTDFSSKSDFSDGGGGSGPKGSTPKGGGSGGGGDAYLEGQVTGSVTEGSLGHESGYSGEGLVELRAPNVYPLHLLYITNYRLPGDVDRSNLERHMTDKDFDQVFKMSRPEFYQIPYWKQCDIKRKANLF